MIVNFGFGGLGSRLGAWERVGAAAIGNLAKKRVADLPPRALVTGRASQVKRLLPSLS